MNVLKKVTQPSQFIPLALTIVVLAVLSAVLYLVIFTLNSFGFGEPIILAIRKRDVLVGITIYLKTAIDFAIFMGRLMESNPGWKNRIAIEIGTAAGNALGTILVIILWVFFKEIDWLLAVMVFIASLVLLELAHGSLHYIESWGRAGTLKRSVYRVSHLFLTMTYKLISPILSRIMPDVKGKLAGTGNLTWVNLLIFSFSVPFILGLDDFAGYVPLFNVINVFGFSLGVFAAHTVLNIALFLSPSRTIKAVKNEYISFVGLVAFVGIAFYGFYEVWRILSGSH